MSNEKVVRRRFDAGKKVAILREHLENRVGIAELARKYGIHPNMLYDWKKRLFEGALGVFEGREERNNGRAEARMKQLEEQLRDKSELIAEVVADNVRLKKTANGVL
jgi:transposase